jgi:hypothetical protein
VRQECPVGAVADVAIIALIVYQQHGAHRKVLGLALAIALHRRNTSSIARASSA